uniref:Uncharacterized protein n=1 Tax=Ananas comosus var. bracteatus TaxID=296719 RepID=A0A6V7QT20_ANACO
MIWPNSVIASLKSGATSICIGVEAVSLNMDPAPPTPPPFLDTNSFLTQTLDDFLLHGAGDDSDDPDDDDDDDGGAASAAGSKEERNRRALAKEEAKLEREIIRIVHSGDFLEALKPNSGQSVSIGDHNICVGFHEDPGSEYRVWEWHGHVMLFDEEEGYSAEYIYGNYFERLAGKKGGNRGKKDERGGNLGLRDLIGGSGIRLEMAGAGSYTVTRSGNESRFRVTPT